MIVDVVLYQDYLGVWKVGNVYKNKQAAKKEADERDGLVLTRQIL